MAASTPDVRIRTLGPSDAAPARALLGLFARVFDDPAAYTARQPDDAYLAALLGRDTFIALIALDADDAVVGGAAAYVLPKLEQARSELYLYDLAVDEAHRRCGVATALIRELGHVAAARGIWMMFVQADHGDDAAIALYTRLGVREDVLHFDIEPSPRPAN
jgi:ribosomal protein S18 acetylase RimI-like enzyme